MKTYALIGMYILAIIAANLSVVAFGPAVTIINAFVFISIDLTSRDYLHEDWRGRGLVLKMAALIATGSLLSWLLNASAGQVALASFVAFAVSASADALTYAALGNRSYLVKVNGSNTIGAFLDSLIFPLLAFGFPLLWWVVIGQFVAKIVGGAFWSIVLPTLRDRRKVATP